MKNNFPHVFSPLTIRGMTLKNRVVMMPMGSDFAGHDGELSDEENAKIEAAYAKIFE